MEELKLSLSGFITKEDVESYEAARVVTAVRKKGGLVPPKSAEAELHSLKLTTSSPLIIGRSPKKIQKGNFIFQALIFRLYVGFREDKFELVGSGVVSPTGMPESPKCFFAHGTLGPRQHVQD